MTKREFRRLLAGAGIRPVRLYDLGHTAATLGIAAEGLGEGHLGSVGTCQPFIQAGALFPCAALDPGRGGREGGKAAR